MSTSSVVPEGASFRRFGLITIVAVYILIAVGSIVRATGAGMGCPDWPHCFGQWIPPTDVSQLPPDYKTRFAIQGKEIADFNAVHTWTEYVNRLIGVSIGLLIFITFVLSTRYWQRDKAIPLLSLAVFLLVAFEGWLGAVVVKNDLLPITITLHLAVALVIVMLLIYTVVRSHQGVWRVEEILNKKTLNTILLVGMLLSFLQIVLGTQVRQQVDIVSKAMNYSNRDQWLDTIGVLFYVHRSFSLLVFGIHLWFVWLLRKSIAPDSPLQQWGTVLLGFLGVEILSGVVMAYVAMPKAMQPLHLVLASAGFGIEFMIAMRLNYRHLFLKNSLAPASA